MGVQSKTRDKLLQFSNFWFGLEEETRHIILFVFPLITAAFMTAIGSQIYRTIEQYFGRNINFFLLFLVWTAVMFIFVWMLAIIMDDRHKLEEQMCLDYLTGVYSRGFLFKQAISMIRRASFDRKIVCVCFIDMDNLKLLNNTSHLAGDEALSTLGQTIDSVMRKKVDAVGRYGGDEFLAVWTTENTENINATYKRITDALGVMSFAYDGRRIKIAASTGLSFGRCAPEKDPERELTRLIKQADEALKGSKMNKG